MRLLNFKALVIFVVAVLCSATSVTSAPQSPTQNEERFGPVVRAYLGYLEQEQEVVDDRASRHEVSPSYYRRNSNRIRALRQMALRLARESQNDYLPELEAVARDEMSLLFERPPQPQNLKEGDILRGTFRFLGAVRSGEVFYIFARLDPYEQSDLREDQPGGTRVSSQAGQVLDSSRATRERRVTSP